ncbi:MAG: phosphate signaling complex protein PhoU [Acidimicrobiia bacterium]
MSDHNAQFHDELDNLEQRLLDIIDTAEGMVGRAVESVVTGNIDLANEVIEADLAIDEENFQIHQDWTTLMARYQPLGPDLRRMAVLLHLNITFERMGDQCVNIAKITRLNEGLPSSQRICDLITEMGDLVRPMIRTAIEAFVRKDLDEARLLPAMDEPVDRINANMYREAVEVSGDRGMLEWATKMILVSRALERIGDQSVDFAEQTAYLITGDRLSFDEAGLVRSLNEPPD